MSLALNTLMHRAVTSPPYLNVKSEKEMSEKRASENIYTNEHQLNITTVSTVLLARLFLWVSLNSQAIFYQQKPPAWSTMKARSVMNFTWYYVCSCSCAFTTIICYLHYTVELFVLTCILCHCICC